MSDPIRTRQVGAVLEVIIDRPKANAIDLATSRAMGLVFRDFRDDQRDIPFAVQAQALRFGKVMDLRPHVPQPRFENGPSAARVNGRQAFIGATLDQPLVEVGP